MKKIALAWTGASGALYGLRLLEQLLGQNIHVFLMISEAARAVFSQELFLDLPDHPLEKQAKILDFLGQKNSDLLTVFALTDWMSPLASGSGGPSGMVICPCSMGTLAAIAHGLSDNLIERAADVMLKEHRQLILVPRETPLSSIHLENMLTLSKMGAVILPAMPGFYQNPTHLDDLIIFVVNRILSQLGLPSRQNRAWGQ